MSKNYKFKRGFKTLAENKSIEFRKVLGIGPSLPLPGITLANHLNVKVLYPDSIKGLEANEINCLKRGIESNWSGVALKAGSTNIIIINNSHSIARQESSIMHELAHLICKHEMGEFQMLSDGLFLRNYNIDQEKEAEWMGGSLQLPRLALYYHYEKYKLSIEEIAEKFNASIDMVRFRLNVCGIIRKRNSNFS